MEKMKILLDLLGKSFQMVKEVSTTLLGNSGFLTFYSFLRSRFTKYHLGILAYHSVCGQYDEDKPLTPSQFEEQIRYLCHHYEIITLDTLVSLLNEGKTPPRKTVVLTFDDGYKDNYIYAYPILKKYGAPATIFLATSFVDNKRVPWQWQLKYVIENTSKKELEIKGLGYFRLDSSYSRKQIFLDMREKLKKLTEEGKDRILEDILVLCGVKLPTSWGEMFLSWEEIKEMSQGGIDFGSHTVNHIILTNVPLKIAEREITQSKREIEEKIGKEVRHFAYPNGNYNDEIIKLVKRAGYLSAVTFGPSRLVTVPINLYTLDRITMGSDFQRANLYISGLYPDLKKLLKYGA
jgi:peptidoglycan/xylan/chitin deacetylase (PgdA/CDA1 family)